MMFIIFLLFFLGGIFVYFKLYKPTQYWKERNVKYSRGWPLIGCAKDLLFRRKSFFETIEDLYNEFPNLRYNGIFFFNKPSLLIRDLDLIKDITIKDFDHFTDHVSIVDEQMDPIMGKSLFLLKSNKWKAMRATLSPVFTSSKMRAMFILMSESAEEFTKHFSEKKEEIIEADMKDIFSKYTNDVIASTAFGVHCDSLKDPENDFYVMGKKAIHMDEIRALKFFIAKMLPGLFKFLRLHIMPKEVEQFLMHTVTDNIKQREENNIIRPDFIHLLMEARKGKLKYEQETDTRAGFATAEESTIGKTSSLQITDLSDIDITAQALIFFFGGFEPTATLSSFLAYELAVNLDVQEKLQKEIDDTLKKSTEKVSYEDLNRMSYLDQVVTEALRKWTSQFIIERVCVKNYTIEPKTPEEKPLLIEKGDGFLIPVIGIHKNPELYPNPEKFDPDRFSEENKSRIVPGSYLPFGLGPRNCIGSRFVLLEVKVLFLYVLSKFDLIVTKKTDVPLKLQPKLVQIPENGIWIGLKKRNI